MSSNVGTVGPGGSPIERYMRHELHHLRDRWWWFLALGVLLVACGTVAIIFPIVATVYVALLLGLLFLISGVATIVGAFWAGKWSGLLMQLLVGILYVVSGFVITENPIAGAGAITLFLSAAFIVLGIFRAAAALVVQFPQWGWALLNGVVTFLAGIIIFRNYPEDVFWVLGLLVGLEMLFNGWTWIMLSLALRSMPEAKD
jgi:uncharacterized membrane protein HdeD (DUF308 family)